MENIYFAGIPDELWDSPSVEVSRMKQECEQMLSEYEDDLEDWYMKDRLNSPMELRESLQKFLCVDRVLRHSDKTCLSEETEKKSKKMTKGDRSDL